MKAAADLVLGGRYQLLELLATGGMGEVWSANDLSVGRTVAVKVLREEYTGHQEFLRRLRTEARNSAALAHPNIAQMYDYGEEAGTGYLVMELVPGESLADLLDRQPVLPAHQLIPILADTARGLQHAHANSVVHRDVKPGNILLQEVLPGTHPKVKITDFGVSLAANQAPMTATGMVMGTAQYLSPEQAVGNPATARSDLYALGVIAYEASVGKRPFSGKSPVDIAIAHVNDPVPPLPRSVDPRLAQIIMRLLAKDPAERPATAAVLAAELDALIAPPTPAYSHVNSAPIPVVPPPSTRRGDFGVGANPAPAMGAGSPQGESPAPAYPSRISRRSAIPPATPTQGPGVGSHAATPQPDATYRSTGAGAAQFDSVPPVIPPVISPVTVAAPPNRAAFLPGAELTTGDGVGSALGGSEIASRTAGSIPSRPPVPMRSSVRRPVSPVASSDSSRSSNAQLRYAPAGARSTANAWSAAENPRHSAVSARGVAPSFNHSSPPGAALRQTPPTPQDPETTTPPPPSRLTIGAIVVGLIIILYLIVRLFADDAASVGGQMSDIQGTIVLSSYSVPLMNFARIGSVEIGRHLGG